MSYATRFYYGLILTVTLIAFPIALIIFAFSSSDIRKRAEKKACKKGEVEECVYVDADPGSAQQRI